MPAPVSPQTQAAIEAATHIGEKLLTSKRRLAAAVLLLQSLERSFAAEIDADEEISGAAAVDFITAFIVGEVRPFLALLATKTEAAEPLTQCPVCDAAIEERVAAGARVVDLERLCSSLAKALELASHELAAQIGVPFEECVSGPVGIARAALAEVSP